MAYRLTYWNKRGRAEQVRLLLNELGEEYVDVHVDKGAPFAALQAQGASVLAFGSVPMLDDDGFRLVQGPVIVGYLARKHGLIDPTDLRAAARADAVALGAEDLRSAYFGLFGEGGAERQRAFVHGRWTERWLPRFSELLEINGTGTFVGPGLTHADVAVWDALDAILAWVEGASLADHPRLAAFYADIAARPRIASYLASPRRAAS